jgi:very-short-patch-repair endonuclease
MDLISQVTLLGGVTDRATLVRLRSAREVDGALASGVLVRDARGRYALPTASNGMRVANSVHGVLSHRSAAQRWGWAQKHSNGLPEVTVPRNRKVSRALREVLIPHWSDLPVEDIDQGATSMRRTLIDCMRNLPFDEALSIVVSAIRARDVTSAELKSIARWTNGRGRQRIIAVAEAATGKAANPFESVTRAQALLIPGLDVQAQYPVHVRAGLVLHPDLAVPELKIAFECEGFEWHGDSAALTRDCRRYNMLTNLGWHVIRFSWYLVMHAPLYVQWVIREALAAARARLASIAEHANVA